jgi:hypothetical protein
MQSGPGGKSKLVSAGPHNRFKASCGEIMRPPSRTALEDDPIDDRFVGLSVEVLDGEQVETLT